MLRQQVIVESDVVQATRETHSNIVVCQLAEASHDGSDFGAEEDEVAARLQVDDVVHSRSGSLSALCTIYRQLGDASVPFEPDVVPGAVVDHDASQSNESFSTAAIEAILHLEDSIMSKEQTEKEIDTSFTCPLTISKML